MERRVIIQLRKFYHPACFPRNWKLIHSFIHCLSNVYPLHYRFLYVTHATRAFQSKDLSGEGINSGSHTYFYHTRTWRVSPDEGSAQWWDIFWTWKTIHTIHAPIHSSKANMKGWLRWPNYIQEPYGAKAFWHLSYRWGKTPKKPHPGNFIIIRSRVPGYGGWVRILLFINSIPSIFLLNFGCIRNATPFCFLNSPQTK